MGIGLIQKNVTVATAGTRVQLFTTATSTYASSLYVEAAETNTGTIYLGNSTVSSTLYSKRLLAGQGFSINAEPQAQTGTDGGCLWLANFWVDSSANTQVVQVTFLPKLGTS